MGLDIEIKALSLFKTPAGKSLYRLLAPFKVKLDAAGSMLTDAMLEFTQPEEHLYESLNSIKDLVAGVCEEVAKKMILYQQADQDPHGFKAIHLFEEKEALKVLDQDDETVKAFKACLKSVKENP